MARATHKTANEFLVRVAGNHALKIINAITEPQSDEELAETCKIKISDVRAVLNKLHYYGVVHYERKRDNETGWYSYIWHLNNEKLQELLRLEEQRTMDVYSLEQTTQLFKCTQCHNTHLPFEAAFDVAFKCPSCGSSLSYYEGFESTVVEKKPSKKRKK